MIYLCKLLFSIFVILVVVVGVAYIVYILALKIVMRIYDVDKEDAEIFIRAFLTSSTKYDVSQDACFIYEMEETIKAVLGEEVYLQLVKLANITPLIWGTCNGFSCICAVLPNLDENQKSRLEFLLKNLLEKYLRLHNCYPLVLVDWKEHNGLKMPCLMLRYAGSIFEHVYIKKCLEEEAKKISNKFQPITDEEMENDV